jgi:hypothetical protein
MIKYFVILADHTGELCIPLIHSRDHVKKLEFFETQMGATKAGNDSPLGYAHGYKVMALSQP